MIADKHGRRYAKLSQLKAGDKVEVDSGFTCMKPGKYMIHYSKDGGYLLCDDGQHKLCGQDDGDGYCVGVYNG